MIPTPRLAWWVALGVPLSLLGLFGPGGLLPFAGYELALLGAVLIEALRAPHPGGLTARRELSPRGVQGRSIDVELQLSWRSALPGRLRLRDDPPRGLEVRSTRFDVRVRPRSRAVIRYRARAVRRGVQRFGPLTVRTRGPFGLIERESRIELNDVVRVYPDLITLSSREASLVVPSQWTRGARRGRIKGEGREFHQLRAYVPGDDPRRIDWKGFARRGRPVVREHRAERNQRVLLLIDGGRLMTVQVGDRLRFDWAVQAAGRLARVALAIGDQVGLAVYSRKVSRHVPASRRPGQLGRLSDVLCEAGADTDEADLEGALRKMVRDGSRRTLVVLFSEIADPRAAEATVRHIGLLAPRHVGLVVTLADTDLDAERHTKVTTADAAYRRLAADELWMEYRRTARALESRGAMVVRARADALAAETVERYAEIKRQGRL